MEKSLSPVSLGGSGISFTAPSEGSTLNLCLVLHIAPSGNCLHLSTRALCPPGTIHQVNVVIDLDFKVINLTGNRGKYSYRHQGHGYNPFPSNH